VGRGRDEPQASYLLLHDDLPDVVIMSEQERNLWGLCTGENSVESICQQYLIHRRTLILQCLITMVKRLWAAGFLASDPENADAPHPRKKRTSFDIPGSDLFARALAALPLPLRRL